MILDGYYVIVSPNIISLYFLVLRYRFTMKERACSFEFKFGI